MSAIGVALYGIVRVNSTVQSLIGDGGSPVQIRFYPAGNIPQDEIDALGKIPAVTYQTIGGAPANTFDAAAPADNERIQIDAWALNPDAADTLLDAVREAIESQAEQIAFGIGIQIVSFNGKDYNDVTKRYRSSFDVSVWINRV